MFCSKCGKEIADDAEFCQFCGEKINKIENNEQPEISQEVQPKNKKDNANGCLIFGLIIIFFIFVFPVLVNMFSQDNNVGSSNNNEATCPSDNELEDAISQYKSGKIIGKFQPELNTVYITTAAQNQMSVDDIQTLGYLTACYSAYKKGNNLVWVDIYNYNSGKLIAKYSKNYGFEMK